MRKVVEAKEWVLRGQCEMQSLTMISEKGRRLSGGMLEDGGDCLDESE
jgi:hypothetical protein